MFINFYRYNFIVFSAKFVSDENAVQLVNDKNVREEGFEAYGDVMINYVERNGQEKSAYICDYEWDIEDAVSICQYLG